MLGLILERGNDALNINRPNANRNLTRNGSNWLWAVTAIFGLTFLGWLVWTLLRNKEPRNTINDARKPQHGSAHNGHNTTSPIHGSHLRLERVFHYLWTIAAFVGFISYFTMASDLGNTPVRQHLNHGFNPQQTRQVFYVRYIYWFIAWPLIITANLLISGVSWATILFTVALQEVWVVSWLSGALVRTSYKWGFFTFGLVAYFILAYILLGWGIEHGRRIRTGKEYTLLAGVLVGVWALFPIAWGLSEGGNKLSVTGEMIFYGILDLITVPLYGTLFLFYTKRLSPALVQFTQSGRVLEPDHHVTPLPGGSTTIGTHGHNGHNAV